MREKFVAYTYSAVKRGLSKVIHGEKSYKMTPPVKQVCIKLQSVISVQKRWENYMRKRKTDESWRRGLGDLKGKNLFTGM